MERMDVSRMENVIAGGCAGSIGGSVGAWLGAAAAIAWYPPAAAGALVGAGAAWLWAAADCYNSGWR